MYKIWSISLRSYLREIYETTEQAKEAIKKMLFENHYDIVEEKDWETYQKEHEKKSKRKR